MPRPHSIFAGWEVLLTLLILPAALLLASSLSSQPSFFLLLTLTPFFLFWMIREGYSFLKDFQSQQGISKRKLTVKDFFFRLIGIFTLLSLIFSFYYLFPYYQQDSFHTFRSFLNVLLIIASLLTPFYIIISSRFFSPALYDDHLLGKIILTGVIHEGEFSRLGKFFLSWLVKLFFFPLMFNSALNLSSTLISKMNHLPSSFTTSIPLIIDSLFFFDVSIALIGYFLSSRFLNNHIRSVDMTLTGWLVTLICYPPFWGLLELHFLNYNPDGFSLSSLLSTKTLPPLLTFTLGGLMILLIALYVWATFAFGIRFSNLTHRGIITNGPYGLLKHPAYLAKNLYWWIAYSPFFYLSQGFIPFVKSAVLLLMLNGIYYLRAITEERHLSKDPVYEQYRAWMRSASWRERLTAAFTLGR